MCQFCRSLSKSGYILASFIQAAVSHWSAKVMTPLGKINKPCNDLRSFFWTFRNLIFLLYDHSHYGLYSIFYASLIILDISYNNFSEGVPATVVSNFQSNEFVLITEILWRILWRIFWQPLCDALPNWIILFLKKSWQKSIICTYSTGLTGQGVQSG